MHRLEAGGLDDGVDREFGAVRRTDAGRRQRLDLHAGLDADLPVDDELRGADVDIVAGARAQGLHHQPGFVLAEVEQEARRFELSVELGVVRSDAVVERLLLLGLEGERCRCGDHVGLVDVDAALDRRFRVDVEGHLHQRFRAHDVVAERWIMVTSAPASQRSTATSCAELAAPITATFLPLYFDPSEYWLE